MLKTAVIAGVTALALAGGSLVYAQQRGDAPHHGPRMHLTAQDLDAFADARIAALKAGLQLTTEQEKNWPALEKALRDQGKARAERFAARASADKPRDPVERLRLRAEMMSQRGTALKDIADAAAPLYKSLDDAQKHRFIILARLDRQMFGQGHGWRHHGRRGMMQRQRMNGTEDAPKPQ